MNLNNKAARLLKDWQQYKHVHYSKKTQFANAVELEIAKDSVAQLASVLSEAISNSDTSDHDMKIKLGAFSKQLSAFKDRITFELLRNGS